MLDENLDFMLGFAECIIEKGFIPAFRANTDAKFSFDREFSRGVQTNRELFRKCLIWAVAPSLAEYDRVTTTHLIHPDHWKPYAPSVSAWPPFPENGEPRYWRFDIAADRFLRNMVRAVVGTLVEVGRGRRSLDNFASLILPASPDTVSPERPGRRLPARQTTRAYTPGAAAPFFRRFLTVFFLRVLLRSTEYAILSYTE